MESRAHGADVLAEGAANVADSLAEQYAQGRRSAHGAGASNAFEDTGCPEDLKCPEGMEGAESDDIEAGYSAMEGADVVLERPLTFAHKRPGRPARPEPMPRDDPPPEPVRARRRAQGSDGRFRRNPAVDEALGELSRPADEPSPAERAAEKLYRRRKPASSGAMIPADARPQAFTPQQRLLLLDTWTRSGLPAGDFAALVGVSKHTLWGWRKRFKESGPAGLEDAPRGGAGGGKVQEITRRAILMLKEAHPDYGCERISGMLAHGPALPVSAGTVAKVLREAGYVAVDRPTKRHPDKPRRFERASPNQLWQTDLFTFMLKRQNRRVHLVAYMDDHSRFIVGWGLFSSPSTEMVIEALKSAVSSFQTPVELLTDNGAQYVTWRGRSKFNVLCETLGIKQIVAKPRHPETLGKVERFWGTLWREFLRAAILVDMADARERIGRFVDHYNFERPHQGIDNLTPADRYFGRAPEVKAALRARAARNAARLAEVSSRLDHVVDVESPLTPEGSPATAAEFDVVPGPGDDPLTAGLSAAADGEADDA